MKEELCPSAGDAASVEDTGMYESAGQAESEKPIIGTLGERTLHAALKRFFEPDTSFHEIRYKSFVAE